MTTMRLAYLDCFAGISGDMFLGALLDAGLPPSVLHEAAAALDLGVTLNLETVDRSGITSTKVHVLEHGHLAEASTHTHEHAHEHTHAEAHTPERNHSHTHTHTHEHTHSPEHTHEPAEQQAHTHGRSLTVIRDLIRSSPLADPVKTLALQAFELLGHSEAKIHNVPLDQIHFHEVGAVDAIVDIVAASAGIHALNTQSISETGEPLQWHCSPLNVGGGMVQCAHGNFPVPAPATADLLRGLPTYSANIQKELVTPTGAAILRALAPTFGSQPAMRSSQIGYGAGTRNPKGFPNVLRLTLGEAIPLPEAHRAPAAANHAVISTGAATATERPLSVDSATNSAPKHPHTLGSPASFGEGFHSHTAHTDLVTVLETALDDLSPQILAHVTEQAFALGALDVMTTAVGMKKGRPGTLITILTGDEHSPALERLLLRETSTLGIRIHQQRRICLARHHTTVTTRFGDIRIKIGSFDTEAVNAAPEFEDCRAAAAAGNIPIKEVMQAAIAAYVNLQETKSPPGHTSPKLIPQLIANR